MLTWLLFTITFSSAICLPSNEISGNSKEKNAITNEDREAAIKKIISNDDVYDILDVKIGAKASEIKKSFKKLLLLVHPDKQVEKSKHSASEATNKLKSAYEKILKEVDSSPEKINKGESSITKEDQKNKVNDNRSKQHQKTHPERTTASKSKIESENQPFDTDRLAQIRRNHQSYVSKKLHDSATSLSESADKFTDPFSRSTEIDRKTAPKFKSREKPTTRVTADFLKSAFKLYKDKDDEKMADDGIRNQEEIGNCEVDEDESTVNIDKGWKKQTLLNRKVFGSSNAAFNSPTESGIINSIKSLNLSMKRKAANLSSNTIHKSHHHPVNNGKQSQNKKNKDLRVDYPIDDIVEPSESIISEPVRDKAKAKSKTKAKPFDSNSENEEQRDNSDADDTPCFPLAKHPSKLPNILPNPSKHYEKLKSTKKNSSTFEKKGSESFRHLRKSLSYDKSKKTSDATTFNSIPSSSGSKSNCSENCSRFHSSTNFGTSFLSEDNEDNKLAKLDSSFEEFITSEKAGKIKICVRSVSELYPNDIKNIKEFAENKKWNLIRSSISNVSEKITDSSWGYVMTAYESKGKLVAFFGLQVEILFENKSYETRKLKLRGFKISSKFQKMAPKLENFLFGALGKLCQDSNISSIYAVSENTDVRQKEILVRNFFVEDKKNGVIQKLTIL